MFVGVNTIRIIDVFTQVGDIHSGVGMNCSNL